MTTLIVNDQQAIELATAPGQSVFDSLLAAQDQWDSTQLIRQLEVNGEVIQPLEEAVLRNIPAHETEIRIILAEPQVRTIAETIEEAFIYLDRLKSGFEEVANHIRTNNSNSAHGMLKDGMDGLSTILQLVDHLNQYAHLPAEMREEFDTFIQGINDKTLEMTDAQGSGDPTLIADILEYEFIDVVVDLKRFLTQVTALLA